MLRNLSNKSNLNLDALAHRILTQERITTQEHLEITSALLRDYQLTTEMRQDLNLIFEQIQEKRISIVD
ncbi:hypothetical protein NG798_00100 [Ancylothrix sp. C2]|uniref:hypothetical protein n=1 Tax=Ancylothrix sp. D3o TaxID=2953691 RepID=UPI0021BA675D|nr:hypothetical protein [Ancylothrix sp. D3o]MCT7948192.1 hypothetical protein [Ancylothrix sp. D3o]